MISSRKNHSIQMFVNRVLEGKISQLNFLILLGFAATLAMLYIGLHVYSYSLSEGISSCSKKCNFLREKKVWLMADYNRLIAPERVIPEVEKMGMKQGSSLNINELTLYRNHQLFKSGEEDPERVTSLTEHKNTPFSSTEN